jgi:hypothetical protein
MLYAHRSEAIAESPMRDAGMKRIHDTASWKHVESYDYAAKAWRCFTLRESLLPVDGCRGLDSAAHMAMHVRSHSRFTRCG